MRELDLSLLGKNKETFSNEPDVSIVSLQEVSNWLGLTKQRVLQLTKEGLPKRGANQYPLFEVVRWFLDRKLEEIMNLKSDSYTEARQRLLEARATKAELDVQERNASHLDAGEVENRCFIIAQKIKDHLQGMPGKFCRVFAKLNSPQEILKLWEDEQDQLFNLLAEDIKDVKNASIQS